MSPKTQKKNPKNIQCYLGDGGLAVEELEAPDLEEPFFPNGRDHSEIRFSSGLPASPSAPRNQSSKALQKKYGFRWEGFGWVLDRFLLKFWSLKIETELETTSPRAVRSSRLHPLPDEVPRAFAGLRGRCIVRTHQCWFLVRSFLPVPNDGKRIHKNRPEITTGVPCSFKAFARSCGWLAITGVTKTYRNLLVHFRKHNCLWENENRIIFISQFLPLEFQKLIKSQSTHPAIFTLGTSIPRLQKFASRIRFCLTSRKGILTFPKLSEIFQMFTYRTYFQPPTKNPSNLGEGSQIIHHDRPHWTWLMPWLLCLEATLSHAHLDVAFSCNDPVT